MVKKTRVIYIGPIRNLSGRREEEVALPDGATARDLLQVLAKKYGEPFREVIFNGQGQLQPMVRLLVQGSEANPADLDKQLGRGAPITIVHLLQPLVGG